MNRPSKAAIDRAKREIADEDRAEQARLESPEVQARAVESLRRVHLPSEDPDHLCGPLCDGQDGRSLSPPREARDRMSVQLQIECDRCGKDSGRTVLRSTGVVAFRALLATLGWRMYWFPPDKNVHQPADRCPECQ